MCLLHMCETRRTASSFTHELAGLHTSRSLLSLSPILHWTHRCSLLFQVLYGFGGSELKSSCLCLMCPLSCLSSPALSELHRQRLQKDLVSVSGMCTLGKPWICVDSITYSNRAAQNCHHLQSHGLQLEPLSCLWVSVWTFARLLLHRGYVMLLLRL